jgi:hypothetical protein
MLIIPWESVWWEGAIVEGVLVSIFDCAKVMKIEKSMGAHDDYEALMALKRRIKATTNLSHNVLKGSDAPWARKGLWRVEN